MINKENIKIYGNLKVFCEGNGIVTVKLDNLNDYGTILRTKNTPEL